MVKGISRQVIVVQNPDKDLFEQAIFILTDEAVSKGVSDQQLLRQANQAIAGVGKKQKGRSRCFYGPAWAAAGAAVTGLAWLITLII